MLIFGNIPDRTLPDRTLLVALRPSDGFMAKHKAKSKKKKTASKARKLAANKRPVLPTETRASESLTIFWSVSVLIVLTTNVITLVAHFYLQANPGAEKMALFKGLMLFSGALAGGLSLIVLVVIHRIRVVPPPRGLTVFGACVAAAPILAALARAFG